MIETGVKMIAVFFYFLFALVNATEVNLESSWKPDEGWEVTCSWKLYANDSLQSVRLHHNEQQFMIYRPEIFGTKRIQTFRLPEKLLKADCIETAEKGLTGKCILTSELYQPPTTDFTYTCEVSGERPMFRIDKKDILIKAFVTPSDAAVVVVNEDEQPDGRVMLNCTSSGLPAPNLVWTVDNTKVPNDFSGSAWNATSKLWHVWSLLSYTHSNSALEATCTPEANYNDQSVKGHPAQYNSAIRSYGKLGVKNIIGTILLSMVLLR